MMARRRSLSDQRIFFPWESRGGIRRWMGLGKMRPVLLVALLLGGVLVVAVRERHRSAIRQTRAGLLDLRRSIDAYRSEHDGGCPPTLGAVVDYGRFTELPRDAWGRPFRLICPGRVPNAPYELSSDGPDGLPEGLDRIQ
ncbi:MAG TPA: type II secretion system protein GspG [Polyangiaceae bacterium]|jgi:general secretion pathway protein G